MFEVELKFRAADEASIREQVAARGGRFATPEQQADTYYAHPQRNFTETDEALRIRRVGAQARITYKGPKVDAETKTRQELETPLIDDAAHHELLLLLGFREVATVLKRRRTAELEIDGRHFEVCLDEVEGLGSFVELETAAEPDDLAAARTAIQHLAADMGLTQGERRGYLDLLLLQDEA